MSLFGSRVSSTGCHMVAKSIDGNFFATTGRERKLRQCRYRCTNTRGEEGQNSGLPFLKKQKMNTWCERTKEGENGVSHQMLLQTKELHQLQLIVQRQIWDREREALEGEVKKLREQACCWEEKVARLEAEVSHLRSSLSRNMSSESNNCGLERSSGAGGWRSSDSRARTAKTGHEERETEGSMSISPISCSSTSTDNDVCHPATSPVGTINPVAGLRQRLSSAEQVYKRLQRAGWRRT